MLVRVLQTESLLSQTATYYQVHYMTAIFDFKIEVTLTVTRNHPDVPLINFRIPGGP